MEQHEKDAAVAGGAKAGEYLDGIGKSDLASMTKAEWETFCQTLFEAACDALRKWADDDVPF